MLSRLTTNLVIRCKLNIKEVKLESTTGDTWDNNRLINKILLDIPGGTPLDKLYRYARCQRIWFSKPFWSENVDSSASYPDVSLVIQVSMRRALVPCISRSFKSEEAGYSFLDLLSIFI